MNTCPGCTISVTTASAVVEPRRERMLALKSSVHFRADFGPLADRVLVVEAPGPNVADPAKLPFTKLPIGRRRRPIGP